MQQRTSSVESAHRWHGEHAWWKRERPQRQAGVLLGQPRLDRPDRPVGPGRAGGGQLADRGPADGELVMLRPSS